MTRAARISSGSLDNELRRRSRTLKVGLEASRHVHAFLHFADGCDCPAERSIWCKIERDCDRRELPLVRDGKRLSCGLKVRESAEGMALAVVELVAPADVDLQTLKWSC